MSAADLVAAIRTGNLSAVDATTAFLDRIDRIDPQVRALAHLDRAGAIRQARAADRARAAGGPLGPLHGVPMTIKDAFRVAGTRSTFGVPLLRWYRPRTDCEAVARLRRAGAVVLGRTAVPFACFDWQCRPPLGRECVNPFDPTRTPGGSSGGAAAALAARLTPLELGTDVAGSTRYPAHCCGVFALRTSTGLVPAADIGPPPGEPMFPSALAVSPMARTPEDLHLLFAALMPAPDPREVTPAAGARLRIAVTPEVAQAPLDGPSAAAFAALADRLRGAGHEVAVVDPPFDFDEGFEVWGRAGGYELKRQLPFGCRNRLAVRAFAAWFLRHRLGDGPLTTTLRAGLLDSEAEYRAQLARREDLARRADTFFGRYDLWALPVSPGPAIARRRSGRPFTTERGASPYSHYLGTYLCPTVPAGTAALVGPIGADPAGLPIGVQFHARRFADRWLVAAARDRLGAAFVVPAAPFGDGAEA